MSLLYNHILDKNKELIIVAFKSLQLKFGTRQ